MDIIAVPASQILQEWEISRALGWHYRIEEDC